MNFLKFYFFEIFKILNFKIEIKKFGNLLKKTIGKFENLKISKKILKYLRAKSADFIVLALILFGSVRGGAAECWKRKHKLQH